MAREAISRACLGARVVVLAESRAVEIAHNALLLDPLWWNMQRLRACHLPMEAEWKCKCKLPTAETARNKFFFGFEVLVKVVTAMAVGGKSPCPGALVGSGPHESTEVLGFTSLLRVLHALWPDALKHLWSLPLWFAGRGWRLTCQDYRSGKVT